MLALRRRRLINRSIVWVIAELAIQIAELL
jgi:hypothetical protein